MFKFLISACTFMASIAIAQAQPQNNNPLNSLGESVTCSAYFEWMPPNKPQPGMKYPKECVAEYEQYRKNTPKALPVAKEIKEETKKTKPGMNSLGEPHPCSSYFGFMHPSFREPGTYPKECIKEYDAAHPKQKKSRVGESASF